MLCAFGVRDSHNPKITVGAPKLAVLTEHPGYLTLPMEGMQAVLSGLTAQLSDEFSPSAVFESHEDEGHDNPHNGSK